MERIKVDALSEAERKLIARSNTYKVARERLTALQKEKDEAYDKYQKLTTEINYQLKVVSTQAAALQQAAREI